MKRLLVLLVATSCVALLSNDASSALFRDQMTDPNAWGKNETATDNTVTFAYDYSADGIPEAPNGEVGDTATAGVKLEANNTDFLTGAVSFTLYPLGKSFSGKYQLQFDMWQNYSVFDREDEGGKGTTEFAGGGLGYDPNGGGAVGNGHQTINTNEGGSGSDYRSFKGGFFLGHADMVCGSRNATGCSSYTDQYPLFSGVPPAVQNQDPIHQGGGDPNNPDPNHQTNRSGTPGFQWVTHTISVDGNTVRTQQTNKLGNTINISVYDTTVLDPNNVVATDGNISIFYADLFSSISPHAELTFGIVDNVLVTVPEPASILMFGLGGLGYALIRRRR